MNPHNIQLALWASQTDRQTDTADIADSVTDTQTGQDIGLAHRLPELCICLVTSGILCHGVVVILQSAKERAGKTGGTFRATAQHRIFGIALRGATIMYSVQCMSRL